MRKIASLLKILLIFIAIASGLCPASTSEKPEIFVQLGHRGNVGSVVFSQDLF